MATSYRKRSPLDPKDILVFEKAATPPKRKSEVQKIPEMTAPTQLHDVAQIVEAINRIGKYGKFEPKKLQAGDSFTLSPRHAWIEGRGYLEALNIIAFAPDMPTIQFVDSIGPSDDARFVDIWLQNLTPGQSYIAQIRVVAGQGGEFHVRTSNATHAIVPGGDRTIPVLLFQVADPLALIKITNIGDAYYWAFVDVTITAI